MLSIPLWASEQAARAAAVEIAMKIGILFQRAGMICCRKKRIGTLDQQQPSIYLLSYLIYEAIGEQALWGFGDEKGLAATITGGGELTAQLLPFLAIL
ncbi:hypothetical protein P5673_005935 [Acropora cervicornis]|uniref:Uncharacterized protein n=1 Tax=Acropora cervicornis TaxID=6130 RepID=A0AAD9QX84_ACRCE|nr:hypothetical protein P5673_005935 [Acropora cervicornis]